MRFALHAFGTFITVLTGGLLLLGCPEFDCDVRGTCPGVDEDRDGDASSVTDVAEVPDTTPDRTVPPGCEEPPSSNASVIDERCAIFVSPEGRDEGAGTRAAPLRTLGKALDAAAAGKRIFACAGVYPENLVIDAARDGAGLFGGFDCATWAYDAQKVPTVKPSSGYPLHLKNLARGAELEDFAFEAPAASAPGASSIGAFVADSSNVLFARVSIRAAEARSGPAASPTPNNHATNEQARTGKPPNNATGGEGGIAQCTVGQSAGGRGGDAKASTGDPGAPGTATPPAPTGGPRTGAGGLAGDLGGCGLSPRAGADGAAPNAVSAPSKLGTLAASGWTPASGPNGAAGNPGQGGGGAGGLATPQPGGGGGGAGGCGGAGGLGGGGGGASIALLLFQSRVTLRDASLLAANAGAGGAGGNGQAGQGGAAGGSADCSGARGGNGSGGGGGAGGAGGISAGIAHLGPAPTVTNGRFVLGRPGAPGESGQGGQGGTNVLGTAPQGPNATGSRPGQAQDILELLP